ncbi:MAG: hypothetical protein J0H50_02115 [Xanthomonadales bacterium]|nr:hypothetical protein [Xanthomonadales bacterium]
MNTPLQRLVDRARGGPVGPALHIEPLLGTSHTIPAGVAHDSPEVEVEIGAEVDSPVGQSAASPPSTPRPVRRPAAALGSAAASRQADPPGTVPSSPDMPLATKPAATGNDGKETTTPTRSRPVAAVEAVRGQEARHVTDTARLSAPARPGYAPHALPRRVPSGSAAMPHVPVAAGQPQQAPLAPIEAAPGITIAIGRIEVRNTPTPVPAGSPHRPFKPGLSLDAFLRRGKGDGW